MRERRLGTSDGTTTREDLGADRLLIDVANYVVGYEIKSRDAVKTARHAILDFVACALRGAKRSGVREITRAVRAGNRVQARSARAGDGVLSRSRDGDV